MTIHCVHASSPARLDHGTRARPDARCPAERSSDRMSLEHQRAVLSVTKTPTRLSAPRSRKTSKSCPARSNHSKQEPPSGCLRPAETPTSSRHHGSLFASNPTPASISECTLKTHRPTGPTPLRCPRQTSPPVRPSKVRRHGGPASRRHSMMLPRSPYASRPGAVRKTTNPPGPGPDWCERPMAYRTGLGRCRTRVRVIQKTSSSSTAMERAPFCCSASWMASSPSSGNAVTRSLSVQ